MRLSFLEFKTICNKHGINMEAIAIIKRLNIVYKCDCFWIY